jgi:prevent-host-death family protein
LKDEKMNWSVADAKARLSEVLRLARAGEPQVVGAQDSCVVISVAEYERTRPKEHLGRALLAIGERVGGVEFEAPPRGPDRSVTMPD